MASGRLSSLAAWSGLIAGVVAWGVHHQVLSDYLHFDCVRDERGMGLALGFGAALLAISGGVVSLRAWRAAPAQDLGARRFIAQLSTMAALLFLFAIILQTAATWILPGCGA